MTREDCQTSFWLQVRKYIAGYIDRKRRLTLIKLHWGDLLYKSQKPVSIRQSKANSSGRVDHHKKHKYFFKKTKSLMESNCKMSFMKLVATLPEYSSKC